MQVRKDSNGDLIYKDTFAEPISKILHDDYRMDGKMTLIACAIDGEVRSYLAAEGELVSLYSMYIVLFIMKLFRRAP